MHPRRTWLFTTVLLGAGGFLPACACGDEKALLLADAAGADGGGSAEDDSGGPPDFGFDEQGRPIDGGGGPPDFGFDEQGRPIDGGGPSADGGAPGDSGPLGQPLSEFCQGTGAVVEVGGGQCSGTVAQRTFRFALCACESLSLQSNLEVDAFDSRLGPYGVSTPGGPNVFTDGHLGINGRLQTSGMIDVQGSVFVSGGGFSVGQQSSVAVNVYSAGTATQANSRTTVGRNMFVNGDVVGRFEITDDLYVPQAASVSPQTRSRAVVRGPIPPVTPCPCAPGELLDVAGYTAYGATHNDNVVTGVLTATTWSMGQGPDRLVLPCGRYYLTRVQHPRTLVIQATDRTVLYIDGDLLISGGLRLELDPGAEIDLFVRGSVSLSAASRLGDEAHPSAVRTYVGGDQPIAIGASSLFGGNLYAPRADVVFGASTDLFGALFAKNAVFSGSASVHFDRAVRSAGEECTGDAGTVDGGPADAAADGGLGADAAPRPDAGGPGVDAGDGGVVPDAAARPDAGTAGPADSGASSCGACFDCPGQACLPVPGGGGVCGPCSTDLDCCPTEVCDPGTGVCRPNL